MYWKRLRSHTEDDVPDALSDQFPGIRSVDKLSGDSRAEKFRPFSDSLAGIAKERTWQEREVGITICVYSFGDIQLTSGTFFCDFGIKVVWRQGEGEFDANPKGTKSSTAIDEAGNEVAIRAPLIDIMNCCSALEEVQHRPSIIEHGLVNSYTRYQTTIKALYNLEMFPFDLQALSIHVRLLDKSMTVVPLQYHELKVVCKQPEWYVYKPYRAYTLDDGHKPLLIFSLVLRRKWEAYWFEVIALQWAVTSLSFASFAMPPSKFDSRSSVSLTLILTSVAFKLYVSGKLPHVAYLTMLDVYTLGSFVLQVMIYAVQGFPILFHRAAHLVLISESWRIDDEQHENFDRLAFCVLVLVWIVFNIYWHVRNACYVRKTKAICGEDPVFT